MSRMEIDGKPVADGIVVRVVNTGTAADGKVGVLHATASGADIYIPGFEPARVTLGQFEGVDPSLLTGGATTDKLRNGAVVRVTAKRGFSAGCVGVYNVDSEGQSAVMVPGRLYSLIGAHQVQMVDPSLLVWQGIGEPSDKLWNGVVAS